MPRERMRLGTAGISLQGRDIISMRAYWQRNFQTILLAHNTSEILTRISKLTLSCGVISYSGGSPSTDDSDDTQNPLVGYLKSLLQVTGLKFRRLFDLPGSKVALYTLARHDQFSGRIPQGRVRNGRKG